VSSHAIGDASVHAKRHERVVDRAITGASLHADQTMTRIMATDVRTVAA